MNIKARARLFRPDKKKIENMTYSGVLTNTLKFHSFPTRIILMDMKVLKVSPVMSHAVQKAWFEQPITCKPILSPRTFSLTISSYMTMKIERGTMTR